MWLCAAGVLLYVNCFHSGVVQVCNIVFFNCIFKNIMYPYIEIAK